jgi:hypothetical protein
MSGRLRHRRALGALRKRPGPWPSVPAHPRITRTHKSFYRSRADLYCVLSWDMRMYIRYALRT